MTLACAYCYLSCNPVLCVIATHVEFRALFPVSGAYHLKICVGEMCPPQWETTVVVPRGPSLLRYYRRMDVQQSGAE